MAKEEIFLSSSSDDDANNTEVIIETVKIVNEDSDKSQVEESSNSINLQSETGKVQRGGSSPNLLSVEIPTVKNIESPNNLVRSVSCQNLAVRLQNPKILESEDKSCNLTHAPRFPSNTLRPKTKKPISIVNDMKPLSRTLSSRSINSLQDQGKKSAIVCKKPEVDHRRPHTAYSASEKKTQHNSDGTLSSEPDTSSDSDLPTNESAKHRTSILASLVEVTANARASKEPRSSANDAASETSAHNNTTNTNSALTSSAGPGVLRQQGKNFLAELDSLTLNLYGLGSLNCIDLAWERNAAHSATSVKFQYINFDEITIVFPKLRAKFPKLQNFTFEETNLSKCGQLNTLAELHQVFGKKKL